MHRFLPLITAFAVLGAAPGFVQSPLAWQKEGVSLGRVGPAEYPRRAVDSQGGAVTLGKPPVRIVSLEFETDEYLYQVVPPERVVGVSDVAYHEGVSNVLQHITRYKPGIAGNIETILRMDPDFVLAADRSRPELVHALQAAGIPVFRLFTLTTTLEQVAENITIVGYLTGNDEAATRERTRFETEIDRIAHQCSGSPREARVFGVSMVGYTHGDQTLFQDLVRLVGAVNVAAGYGLRTYIKVGSETVLRWNPDWVFTWSDPGKDEQELRRWREDPVLGAIAAVENDRVIVSEGKDHLSLSPLVTKLAGTMANALCGKS